MTEKPPWPSGATEPCGFWKHRWAVKEKEILPSFIEQVGADRIKTCSGSGGNAPQFKSCIVTYICYRCGSEKVERI